MISYLKPIFKLFLPLLLANFGMFSLSLVDSIMLGHSIANLLNIFLDWILINGLFGFPQLLSSGAAWSTFTDCVLSLLHHYAVYG